MSTISASSFAVLAAHQTPKALNAQPQQAAGQSQSSSFEQLIASLAGVSPTASTNAAANADKSADDFMNKLLAALQFLQEEPESKPSRRHHHFQENDASQQAAATQAAPVDSSAASDMAVSAPVASI